MANLFFKLVVKYILISSNFKSKRFKSGSEKTFPKYVGGAFKTHKISYSNSILKSHIKAIPPRKISIMTIVLFPPYSLFSSGMRSDAAI